MADGGNVSTVGGNATPETLLVDFLNTYDIETDIDELATPAALSAWASERGFAAGDHAQAVRVRDALRAFAVGEPDAELPRVPIGVRAGSGGVQLAPASIAEAALAAAVTLDIQGRLGRVRLCDDETCRWAFYDRSRNGSRHWCSMGECGNRNKARAYRERRG